MLFYSIRSCVPFGRRIRQVQVMKQISFTPEDRQTLESFLPVADGLAAYLGQSYEVVIHSLENLEHSVIKIVNGIHTGRSVGSPITDLALQMLDKLNSDQAGADYQVYFCKNHRGEPMRSTTIAIRGTEKRIIGLLCINLYLNAPITEFVSGFLPQYNSMFTSEHFAEDAQGAVRQKVEEARSIVESNTTILPSARNKEIIRLLDSWHVFDLKNAIDLVAGELGISSHTVYFHLRNLAKK